MSKPFEIIQWSTDSENRRIINIAGVVLGADDALKLRDELNQLLPDERKLTRRCSDGHHEVEWFNPMVPCPVCARINKQGWCPP